MSSRPVAALLGLVVVVTATVATGMPAVAAPTADAPAVSRLGGVDRYATSAQVALTAYPDGADTVIVASGESFPDALAASPLTGVHNAPILLARSDAAPASVLDAAAQLSPQRLIVVGGVTAVSVEAAQQLAAAAGGARIERIAGTDRFATSLKAAEAVPTQDISAVQGARIALLATGERFPDALAGAPIAAALHVPLLLTPHDRLSDQAGETLTSAGVNQVVILGGEASLAPAIDDQLTALGIAPLRLGGADRQATAAMLADWATTSAGFSTSRAALARGDDAGGGADALTLGALAGLRREPLLLTVSPSSPGAGTLAWFGQHAATLTDLDIAGSEAAVSEGTLDAVSSAAVSGEAPASRGDGSLTLEVTSLPTGGTGAVSVSGPDGYYTRVTATRTLTGLAVGTYRVTAAPAAYAGGTAYPATQTNVVEVGAGLKADVIVDYANQVPTSTKVVAGAAVTSLTGAAGQQQTLTVDTTRAEPVRTGDIIGASSTVTAPDGVLGRVKAVTTNGTTQTAVIGPVSLSDAIPSADFSVRAGSAAATRNHEDVDSARTTLADVPITVDETPPARWPSTCGPVPAVNAQVNADFSIDPTFILDASWGPFRDTTADIGLAVTTQRTISAEIFGSGQCNISSGPLVTKSFPSIKFMVGWFPVVLVPEMSIDATLNASVGASTSCSWNTTETMRFGRQYRDGVWTGYGDRTTSDASGCTGPRAEGRLEALVGLNFDMKLYDLIGPRVSVQAGVRATLQPVDPVWAIDAVVIVSAGLAADAFKIQQDFSLAHEIPVYRLAQAGLGQGVGVCEGVDGCEVVASTDVDGDGTIDDVGLVGGSPNSTVMTARVRTATGILTQVVERSTGSAGNRPEPWSTKSTWYGVAEINGRPGSELVLGDVIWNRESTYYVLTIQDGKLNLLLDPRDDQIWASWSTFDTDELSKSYTCVGAGSIVVRTASKLSGRLTEKTLQWKGAAWESVSPQTERYVDPRTTLGPEWNGWHCDNLPVSPTNFSTKPGDYQQVLEAWDERSRVTDYGYAASADPSGDRDRAVRACLAVASAQDCRDKPVFFPGADVYEAAEHDLLAIGAGQPAILTYYPNRPRSDWYGSDPRCAGQTSRAIHCDEYPYWATTQGGPGASLSPIKGSDNTREGRLLYGFATRCGLTTTDSRDFITAPVVIPDDRISRPGSVSMAYCLGKLIIPPGAATP